MIGFDYVKARDVGDAVSQIARDPNAKFIAGGTNLIDLIKENVAQPRRLIDITSLPLAEIEDTEAGGLRVGALVPNSDLAYDARISKRYPLLSSTILAGASAQLRNMASTGGNLLQRTRCLYFYDTTTACNKRAPGSGCGARDGFNRMNAVLGWSEACIAVHPSDMCVALAALEAVVHATGPNGDRAIPFAEFHRLPDDEPEIDTTLAADEIVIAIELPAQGFARNFSYLKIRDRLSYAFALVSVAVGLDLDGGAINQARIALGGVAHKPWRVPGAEAALKDLVPDRKAFAKAADSTRKSTKPTNLGKSEWSQWPPRLHAAIPTRLCPNRRSAKRTNIARRWSTIIPWNAWAARRVGTKTNA